MRVVKASSVCQPFVPFRPSAHINQSQSHRRLTDFCEIMCFENFNKICWLRPFLFKVEKVKTHYMKT